MSNMSHCRFQNTLDDLRDCHEALSDSLDPLAELSEEEAKAARILIKLCRRIADENEED